MKVLLDSSTLIAAMLPDHVHHAPAHAWLSRVIAGDLEFGQLDVSSNVVAESYVFGIQAKRTCQNGTEVYRSIF